MLVISENSSGNLKKTIGITSEIDQPDLSKGIKLLIVVKI